MKFHTQTSFFTALLAALLSSCSSDSSSADDADSFDAAVVCPAEGLNAYGEPNRGTFTDSRDGRVYKYTTIGSQVWMAENLNFNAPYSACYDNSESFCDTYGRFYSLLMSGKASGLFDQALLDTVCPVGWRVPSVEDWTILAFNMGGWDAGAARLRNADSLGGVYVPGTDDCGFNSLPAGYLLQNGSNELVREYSFYWTSTAKTTLFAYEVAIYDDRMQFLNNAAKVSIRCIKN